MLINHIFKSNESFSYEALRSTGYRDHGGAEVIAICSKIRPGNEDDWMHERQGAAERAFSNAEHSESVKTQKSAYHGYLRAPNYFRAAEFFRRDVEEGRVSQFLYERSETALAKAIRLSTFYYESISIPYEGIALPGYFVSHDDTKKPRRTIIFNLVMTLP